MAKSEMLKMKKNAKKCKVSGGEEGGTEKKRKEENKEKKKKKKKSRKVEEKAENQKNRVVDMSRSPGELSEELVT